jgi:D-alanyl-D-alanine dipeptidase
VSGNNLHAYAGNDPVNFGDPSGLAACPCSQNLLTGLDADLVAGRDYTVKDGVHPYFAPDFAAELSAAIRVLNSWGIIPRINDAYRTQQEQQYLHDNPQEGGACDPNPITGTKVCAHQLGYAGDLSFFLRNSKVSFKANLDYPTPYPTNSSLIVITMHDKNIGWGGFFDPHDRVHFYGDPGGANVKARRDRATQLEDYFTKCIKK